MDDFKNYLCEDTGHEREIDGVIFRNQRFARLSDIFGEAALATVWKDEDWDKYEYDGELGYKGDSNEDRFGPNSGSWAHAWAELLILADSMLRNKNS